MIPGGPLYVFSIGMGYTGEKLAKNLDQKLQKLEENVRLELNGSFCGAFGPNLDSYGVKKYASDDYEVRFKPNTCFRGVLKGFCFEKYLDFSDFWAYEDTK